jgi:hypothetical protein
MLSLARGASFSAVYKREIKKDKKEKKKERKPALPRFQQNKRRGRDV